MKFREATDGLCAKLDHEDVAKALGVSIQTVRQARLESESAAHRAAPSQWEHAVIRLAEKQVWHYRKLIERLREENQRG
jgi:hypothetical protein